MMSSEEDLGGVARAIIDANMYMTLATADEEGRPWVSPVYYASAGYTEFFWVSSPDATHSRNLAARPQLSVVIFDSHAAIGTGQGVYMSAVAEELIGADVDRCIDLFSRGSVGHGGHEWTLADVHSPAPYRLYRATASAHSVLDPAAHPNRRTQVAVESVGQGR